MPENYHAVTTSQSWGERMMASIKGVAFGAVLLLASFGVLFWNEGRAVKTAKGLAQGQRDVQSVGAERVDPAFDGKLIHIRGQAQPYGRLVDREFGIEVEGIHLKRTVEMYQWKESEKTSTTSDGKTKREYTYQPTWSKSWISSQNFKKPEGHQNPPSMPLESQTWNASQVQVGAFFLNANLIASIDRFEDITITAEDMKKLPGSRRGVWKPFENKYYRGQKPLEPQIGDMRVSFQYVKPCVVSVIARQNGNTFDPYMTDSGRTIEMLMLGDMSAASMFERAIANNKTLTWILRAAGFGMMLFGLLLILNPIITLVQVVPILGNLVGLGAFLVSLIVALILSLLTASIAWLFYRPLLSLGLIALAVLILVVTRIYTGKKSVQQNAPAAVAV